MAEIRRKRLISGMLGSTFFVLAACSQPLDFDLRGLGGGFNTAGAARQATQARPPADDRGVISYPNYQVAVARPGDRVADVADRLGISADELGRYNGIGPDVVLRTNEVLALPSRVEEPSAATGAIDITSLAGDAIDRSDVTKPGASAETPDPTGIEPIRHRVEPGETAFSISRLYNVSVRALSEWNGLGSDLTVRSGQYLLIPVVKEGAPAPVPPSVPGQGSVTPEPPSASTPLPAPTTAAPVPKPASPDLGDDRSTSALTMPVDGNIIRGYSKGTSEGIDIAAPAGSPVLAAGDGTVAAITRDTEQVPILVLRHANNLLTVYAGVDGLAVTKGATVKRGQKIAEVRTGEPSFLHFEVRQGLESVDPMQFLN